MARTRVVLSKNRPSSRAGTEPRDTRVATEPRGVRAVTEPRRPRAASVVVSGTIDDDARLTAQFARPVDPTEATEAQAARDSDPYLEMDVSTEPDHPKLRTDSVFATMPVPTVPSVPTVTVDDPITEIDDPITAPQDRVSRQLVKTVPRRLGAGSGTERAIVDQPRQTTTPANPHAIEESSDAAMQRLIESLSDFTDAEPTPKELKWVGVVVSRPEVGASLLIGTWLRKDFRVTTPVAQLFEREDGVLVQTAAKTRYFVKHAGDVYLVR